MIEPPRARESFGLDDYESIAKLAPAVRELRSEAARIVPQLRDRTVWMVNSTPQGGGVAEMLPKMVGLLDELGVRTRWMVMACDRPEFFALTKRVHNLIHGEGDPELGDQDRRLYEVVNRENARALERRLDRRDLLVVHDPQPLAMGAMLKRKLGLPVVWRCHIGLDEELPQTRAAWDFLRPYGERYDHAVFSAHEYVPRYLAGKVSVIRPALDPCSAKNRSLSPHSLVGVLCNAGLKRRQHPVVAAPFRKHAQRLGADGLLGPAVNHHEIGLLYRPIITQISRWDRLKGFRPLLDGFVKLKSWLKDGRQLDPRHRHRLEIVRLVLAGPDASSIRDDPEALEVLEELTSRYRAVPPQFQDDIALLSLPMVSCEENALMVNALQRCSTVVVQNSIREGFGLTATEAMWKRVAVLGTGAFGLRAQIRNGIDGLLTDDPEDSDEIAGRLDGLLQDDARRELMGRSGEKRVNDCFLIFTQLRKWLELLASVLENERTREAAGASRS